MKMATNTIDNIIFFNSGNNIVNNGNIFTEYWRFINEAIYR